MAGLTLDAGALIAAERHDRRFFAYWKEAVARGSQITIPSGVLAQCWRQNTAMVARILKASTVEPLDKARAKLCGNLLGHSRTADIVDASVVLGAIARNDAILTSDVDDIQRLADTLGEPLMILPI